MAFDPVTGRREWEYRSPGGVAMTAAALGTRGGIVFGGTADRRFFALDADTGALLWETRLNGDISGAPVTFEVGGRQYVAVGAGGRIGQTTSYARLTNTTIPQGSGVMVGVRAARDIPRVSLGVRALPPPSTHDPSLQLLNVASMSGMETDHGSRRRPKSAVHI